MASAETTAPLTPGGTEDIGRVVGFTDAVIAIAITLLVLDVAVPEIPDALVNEELGSALWDLKPQVLGFVLSFAVIGYYWLGHRILFSHLRIIDTPMVVINLLFLLVIAFIPFVAALLSQYAPDGLAVAVYAGAMTCAGLSQLAMLAYPTAKGHLHPSVSRTRLGHTARRLVVAPIVFAATVPIAFASGTVAICLWALIPIARGVIARRAVTAGESEA